MTEAKQNQNRHNMWRRTKIIATLGPASKSEKSIGQLIDAGVNIFRLNMSHGTHEEHRQLAARIRKISARKKVYTGILMDLCGPKIRVGEFENGEIELTSGDMVGVSCSISHGQQGLIPSQYKTLYKDVKKESGYCSMMEN